MVLALPPPVHCLTFVSDLELWAHKQRALQYLKSPLNVPFPDMPKHFFFLFLGERDPRLPSTNPAPPFQASSAPSSPQPTKMWFTDQARRHLLTPQPPAVP